MMLAVVALLVAFWATNSVAHPISITPLPKEYYQRQNLPEIPGYIPVYIKHDVEPIVKWKETVRVTASNESGDAARQESDVETTEAAAAASTEGAETATAHEAKPENMAAPVEPSTESGDAKGNSPEAADE